jgi:NAD(P)-dependent dehydrogenase (short-subunit alcohol dehydrogenase family)
MTATVVLIIGALTGIGRATALAFAQEGARLVVSGRRDEAGHGLTQELRSLGVDSSAPTSATKTKSATWSTRAWPALAGSMWPSTTPAPKVSPVQ